MAKRFSMDDLEALAPEWERVFGGPMPMGFEIGPEQVPIMRQCIRDGSRAPLQAYIAGLSKLTSY